MTTTKNKPVAKASAKKQGSYSTGKAVLSAKPTTLLSAMIRNRKGRSTKKMSPEPQVSSSGFIQRPNQNDILFGRGGESNNAHGNRRYQKVIESRCRDYSNLVGRKAKTQLAWTIYKELREEGVRFLKKDKGSKFWTEAPEDACRKKISQRLRERALEAKDPDHKKKGQGSNNNSSKAAVVSVCDEDTATTQNTEEETIVPDFDDASFADVFPETDFTDSDDSIESLMDFADDFPTSWTVEEQPPTMAEPVPVPSLAPSLSATTTTPTTTSRRATTTALPSLETSTTMCTPFQVPLVCAANSYAPIAPLSAPVAAAAVRPDFVRSYVPPFMNLLSMQQVQQMQQMQQMNGINQQQQINGLFLC